MSSEAKFWAMALLCGTVVFIVMIIAGTTASISERDHKYRMAKIKCSEPTNSNKEVDE